jgi:hypothetical protein
MTGTSCCWRGHLVALTGARYAGPSTSAGFAPVELVPEGAPGGQAHFATDCRTGRPDGCSSLAQPLPHSCCCGPSGPVQTLVIVGHDAPLSMWAPEESADLVPPALLERGPAPQVPVAGKPHQAGVGDGWPVLRSGSLWSRPGPPSPLINAQLLAGPGTWARRRRGRPRATPPDEHRSPRASAASACQ